MYLQPIFNEYGLVISELKYTKYILIHHIRDEHYQSVIELVKKPHVYIVEYEFLYKCSFREFLELVAKQEK